MYVGFASWRLVFSAVTSPPSSYSEAISPQLSNKCERPLTSLSLPASSYSSIRTRRAFECSPDITYSIVQSVVFSV